jgi:hypothetical protein
MYLYLISCTCLYILTVLGCHSIWLPAQFMKVTQSSCVQSFMTFIHFKAACHRLITEMAGCSACRVNMYIQQQSSTWVCDDDDELTKHIVCVLVFASYGVSALLYT